MEDVLSPDNYSNEELKEILLNQEDWHKTFIELAKETLESRGIEIEKEEIIKVKQEKIEKLVEGESPNITVFYFMWFFAILGGFIGIIAGYFYWRGKIKGIDGERYFMYSNKYRIRGYYMFWTGTMSAIIQTYIFLKSGLF